MPELNAELLFTIRIRVDTLYDIGRCRRVNSSKARPFSVVPSDESAFSSSFHEFACLIRSI